jgi:hypothetical protein
MSEYDMDIGEEHWSCWIYAGYIDVKGYGVVYSWDGKKELRYKAHRVMYENIIGTIPGELPLDHLCRVRACINPTHLEPVTLKENILRGEGLAAINARKTHCKRGHEFSLPNTIRDSRGNRSCRICARSTWRVYAQRKRDEKKIKAGDQHE